MTIAAGCTVALYLFILSASVCLSLPPSLPHLPPTFNPHSFLLLLLPQHSSHHILALSLIYQTSRGTASHRKVHLEFSCLYQPCLMTVSYQKECRDESLLVCNKGCSKCKIQRSWLNVYHVQYETKTTATSTVSPSAKETCMLSIVNSRLSEASIIKLHRVVI